MGRSFHKDHKDRHAFARSLRVRALPVWEIGSRLRDEWPDLNPRVAVKIANGLTNREVVDRWNALFPDQLITVNAVQDFENGKFSRKRLHRFARVYRCAVSDLLEGEGDFRHLDPHHVEPHHVEPVSTERSPSVSLGGVARRADPDGAGRDGCRSGASEDGDMERREALRLTGGAAAGAALGGSGVDSMLQLLSGTVAVDGVDERSIGAPALAAAMDRLDGHWRRGRYSLLIDELPDLISRIVAGRCVSATGDAERLTFIHAWAVSMVGGLFWKAGWVGPELQGMRRAMTIADEGTDPVSRAILARGMVTGLANNRRTDEAIGLVESLDVDLKPLTTAGSDVEAAIMARGGLLLRLAAATADMGDAHVSWALLDEAEGLAGRLDADHWDGIHEFGPSVVAAQRTRVHVTLHDYGRALAAAATVDVTALSPERRATYHLDAASAHLRHRDFEAATRHLRLAQRSAPEEVRLNPNALELFGELRLPPAEPLTIPVGLAVLVT